MAKPDDLKRIRAVDALLETQLNRLGVRRYSDIARWKTEDVGRISQALGFKERIEQENWIEQAQILARGEETFYSRRLARGEQPSARPIVDEGERKPPVEPAKPATVNPQRSGVEAAAAAAAALAAAAAASRAAAPAAAPAAATVVAPPPAATAAVTSVPAAVADRAAFARPVAAATVAAPAVAAPVAAPAAVAIAVAKPAAPVVAPVAATPATPTASVATTAAQAATAAVAAAAAAAAGATRPAIGSGRDNLQRIGGINAEIEKLLNVQGVTRYSQLAHWSKVEIDRFDRLLGHQGRIQRENWIEQAQILAKGGDTAYSREHDRRTADAAKAAEDAAASRPARLADAIRSNSPADARPRSNDLSSLRSVRSEAFRPAEAAAAVAGGTRADVGSPRVRSAVPDDLKRIRGIGVLIEKKLNSMGVTGYDQIANWSSGDIDRVSQVLDFKGRIERENWVEQARILAAGGQTEFSRRTDRGEPDRS